MKLLLDTHILLWAAGQPDKLSDFAHTLLTKPENSLYFSAANIWEIVIKKGLGRDDFKVDPYRLRKMLVVFGYTEVPVTAEHALRVGTLPSIHRDPFDRVLLAQVYAEGMHLVTANAMIARYQDSVIVV